MPHLALLGDSIFDNGDYVPGQPSLTVQVKEALGNDWQVTCLAVDGDKTLDVIKQLEAMPEAVTHIALSCGGNDALEDMPALLRRVDSITDALAHLTILRNVFQHAYLYSLQRVSNLNLPLVCCTIYDQIPSLTPEHRTALALYNEIILRQTARLNIPVIDLRLLCDEPGDFSEASDIEPSVQGGEKISLAIQKWAHSAGS